MCDILIYNIPPQINFPEQLEKFLIKIGTISAKIHEIEIIKAIFGF